MSTDENFDSKRMKALELFLQNCLESAIICTHPGFVDFLSMTDEAQFKERQP
jgi:hypothetical protein